MNEHSGIEFLASGSSLVLMKRPKQKVCVSRGECVVERASGGEWPWMRREQKKSSGVDSCLTSTLRFVSYSHGCYSDKLMSWSALLSPKTAISIRWQFVTAWSAWLYDKVLIALCAYVIKPATGDIISRPETGPFNYAAKFPQQGFVLTRNPLVWRGFFLMRF